jgi:hypothetical protein
MNMAVAPRPLGIMLSLRSIDSKIEALQAAIDQASRYGVTAHTK